MKNNIYFQAQRTVIYCEGNKELSLHRETYMYMNSWILVWRTA